MKSIALRPASDKLHPTEFRPGGRGSENLVGRDGHINASDRNDLLRQDG